MTMKKLLRNNLLSVLVAAILFFSLYAVIFNVEAWLEFRTQREDAVNKLVQIGDGQSAAELNAYSRLENFTYNRDKAIRMLGLLLDAHPDEEIDLEQFKSTMNWTALCITDENLGVLRGDQLNKIYADLTEMQNYLIEEELVPGNSDFEDSLTNLDGNDTEMHVYVLSDGNYLIGVVDTTEIDAAITKAITQIVQTGAYRLGDNGFFLIQTRTGIDFYSSRDEKYNEDDVTQFLSGVPQDGGMATFEGQKYYVIVKKTDDGRTYAAFLSMNDIFAQRRTISIVYALLYTAFAMLLYWYLHFQKEDEARRILISGTQKTFFGKTIRPILLRRRGHYWAMSIALMLACTFGIEMFFSVSQIRIRDVRQLNILKEDMESEEAETESKLTEYDQDLVNLTKEIALILKIDPAFCTREGISALADKAKLDSIYVFDSNGKTVATNTVFTEFQLSTDEGAQSYSFWNVVNGYDEVCIQEPTTDDSAWHRNMQYIGVARLDAQGMVQIGVVPGDYRKSLSTPLLDKLQGMPALSNDAFYFFVDENGNVKNWPDEQYDGGTADLLGLTEDDLTDGFAGYEWLGGSKYFLTCRKMENRYVFIAMPRKNMLGETVLSALLMFLCGLAAMLFCRLIVLIMDFLFGRRKDTAQTADIKVQGRLRTRVEKFERLNTEEKIERLAKEMLVLGALLLILWYALIDVKSVDASMLRFVLSQKWSHTLNEFSVAYVLWVVMIVVIAAKVFSNIIRWLIGNLSTRPRTVGVLLCNLTQYISAIVTLFYCLPKIGFDPSAIVATATFISFALTFGAQEIIKDFLSGLFLIFEDTIRVGDWVNIDSISGYVEEIGLRMTTIVVEDGVSNVIHNSAVNNLTRQVPLAKVRLELTNPKDVPKARQILLSELHSYRLVIPELLAEPYLERKEEANGVVLVQAQCRMENLQMVEYQLENLVCRTLIQSGFTDWKLKDNSGVSTNV